MNSGFRCPLVLSSLKKEVIQARRWRSRVVNPCQSRRRRHCQDQSESIGMFETSTMSARGSVSLGTTEHRLKRADEGGEKAIPVFSGDCSGPRDHTGYQLYLVGVPLLLRNYSISVSECNYLWSHSLEVLKGFVCQVAKMHVLSCLQTKPPLFYFSTFFGCLSKQHGVAPRTERPIH